jgi:hypothetical protein
MDVSRHDQHRQPAPRVPLTDLHQRAARSANAVHVDRVHASRRMSSPPGSTARRAPRVTRSPDLDRIGLRSAGSVDDRFAGHAGSRPEPGSTEQLWISKLLR